MTPTFRSGDALFVFDVERTIVDWNEAAEELTGIPAAEAVGKPCWDVVRAVDERGSLVCHRGCSNARLAVEGWPVHCQSLEIPTADGTKRVTMSTIAVRGGDGPPLFLHLMRNGAEAAEPAPPSARPATLTHRQLEVLELMDQGCSARTISARLGIAEPTVRNHIRSILLELGCHSQLEALAAARRLGLL